MLLLLRARGNPNTANVIPFYGKVGIKSVRDIGLIHLSLIGDVAYATTKKAVIQLKPMSNFIRGNPIYLSSEVHRLLRIIAKGVKGDTDATVPPDMIADNILRQAITDQYPELVEMYGEIQEVEKKMIKAVQKGQ